MAGVDPEEAMTVRLRVQNRAAHSLTLREQMANECDVVADERDRIADGREAGITIRDYALDAVLARAESRDAEADLRDADAGQRDRVAELSASLPDGDAWEALEATSLARRDREAAKPDRLAAVLDRYELAYLALTAGAGEAASDQRIADAVERLDAADARQWAGEQQIHEPWPSTGGPTTPRSESVVSEAG